jgi:hypothetical protein
MTFVQITTQPFTHIIIFKLIFVTLKLIYTTLPRLEYDSFSHISTNKVVGWILTFSKSLMRKDWWDWIVRGLGEVSSKQKWINGHFDNGLAIVLQAIYIFLLFHYKRKWVLSHKRSWLMTFVQGKLYGFIHYNVQYMTFIMPYNTQYLEFDNGQLHICIII